MAPKDWGKDIDKTGIHLHTGTWATTFAGYAGSGMYWFWDACVEAYRSWRHFQGLNQFLENIDLRHCQPFSSLAIRGPGGGPGQAVGLGPRGEDLLIWLRGHAYTVQAAEADWQAAGSPAFFSYTPPLVNDQLLTLRGIQAGEYTVHWFDPQTARWLDAVKVAARAIGSRFPSLKSVATWQPASSQDTEPTRAGQPAN